MTVLTESDIFSEKELRKRAKIMQWAREREIDRFSNMSGAQLSVYIKGKRCGNCDKWNKSSLCPKEHNVKGYSRGPSSSAFPCNEFTPDFSFSIALEVQTMKKLES